MRVLYLHQYFSTPQIGGGGRSYEFAKRLIAKGHQVTLVCGGTNSEKYNLAPYKKNVFRGEVEGIDVIRINIPYSNSMGLLERAKAFVRFGWQCTKFALKEDYDVLFATTTPLTVGIPGVVMKVFRRKKFVFEVRDLWPEIPKALGLRNPVLLWGMRVLEKRSYHAADGCIGLSPGICEGIKRRSPKGKPITMIPNGCDLDLFAPSERKPDVIPGVAPSDTVAVFTGAHGVANGLDAVLDMASVLKKRAKTDIKMVLVGEGKMKPALKERALKEGLDNCVFLDYMPKKDLNEVMERADIGMMVLANIPAFYYGTSPNKFFDYISSGLPVINNYPGWLADMINENKCGVAVPPENPEAFADALEYLSDHPDKRKEYGLNARALAEREFDRNKLGVQFVNFIENVQTLH